MTDSFFLPHPLKSLAQASISPSVRYVWRAQAYIPSSPHTCAQTETKAVCIRQWIELTTNKDVIDLSSLNKFSLKSWLDKIYFYKGLQAKTTQIQ